jgi:hypothetical protein
LIANVSANTLLQPLYRSANELGAHITDTFNNRANRSFEREAQTTLLVDQFLNQLPLYRARLLRNVAVFIGEEESNGLRAAFDREYDGATPYRIMWEFRNAGQHAILPTSVMKLRGTRADDGTPQHHWLLDINA